MYWRKTWVAGRTVEVRKTFSKRAGIKVPRGDNIKQTTEAQEEVNRQLAIGELRRILNANFGPGDWHASFTYPQKKPPGEAESMEDVEKLMRRLRKIYRDAGMELKAVRVEERNKRPHHHLVIPNLPGGMAPVKEAWKTILREKYYAPEERERGEPKHLIWRWSQLDDSGQYGALAEYLIKETDKAHRERGTKRYSCTRNLIHPKPKIEKISAKAWREEPPERRGYYIDRDASTGAGIVSEVTGEPMQFTVYVLLPQVNERQNC